MDACDASSTLSDYCEGTFYDFGIFTTNGRTS